jgi:hypothetical protein
MSARRRLIAVVGAAEVMVVPAWAEITIIR